jgi:hypothetical protein
MATVSPRWVWALKKAGQIQRGEGHGHSELEEESADDPLHKRHRNKNRHNGKSRR